MVKKLLKITLLFVGSISLSQTARANDFLIEACQQALSEARKQLNPLYQSTGSVNAVSADEIEADLEKPVAFGLPDASAEKSLARETLARLNGLEKYLSQRIQNPEIGDDFRITVSDGRGAIESSLNQLDEWAVTHQFKSEENSGNTWREFGMKMRQIVSRTRSFLRRLSPFSPTSVQESHQSELTPISSQFSLFMNRYREALKDQKTAQFRPYYFATSYFDRETYLRDPGADESKPNRSIDIIFFYTRPMMRPVMMVVDRKI